MVKLSEIKGLLLAKEHVKEQYKTWNDCIDEMASRELTLNRERLAEWFFYKMKIFLEAMSGFPLSSIPEWENADEDWRRKHYEEADILISGFPSLLVAKEEGLLEGKK